jgi:hypothetical protein
MCTLITSKGTDIGENIANQNHATRTRTPKPGYLNLSILLSLCAPTLDLSPRARSCLQPPDKCLNIVEYKKRNAAKEEL